jgi:hypothetical protein
MDGNFLLDVLCGFLGSASGVEFVVGEVGFE